jgi:hypothetical protein
MMGAPDNGFSLNTTDNVRYCADGSVRLVAVMPKGGGGLQVWREKNRAWHRSFQGVSNVRIRTGHKEKKELKTDLIHCEARP